MERAVVAQEFIQGYGRLRKAVDGAPAGTVTMGNIIELRLVTGVPHLS
jgi:hypothetical protein